MKKSMLPKKKNMLPIAGIKPVKVEQESFVFKLNDDCLINIFSMLTIKDRIIAERGMFIQPFFLTQKFLLNF